TAADTVAPADLNTEAASRHARALFDKYPGHTPDHRLHRIADGLFTDILRRNPADTTCAFTVFYGVVTCIYLYLLQHTFIRFKQHAKGRTAVQWYFSGCKANGSEDEHITRLC